MTSCSAGMTTTPSTGRRRTDPASTRDCATRSAGPGVPDPGRYLTGPQFHLYGCDRRRRLLGDDHPSTLDSANNLSIDLHELGELQAACDLAKNTLDRRRRVLGKDHPDTLLST